MMSAAASGFSLSHRTCAREGRPGRLSSVQLGGWRRRKDGVGEEVRISHRRTIGLYNNPRVALVRVGKLALGSIRPKEQLQETVPPARRPTRPPALSCRVFALPCRLESHCLSRPTPPYIAAPRQRIHLQCRRRRRRDRRTDGSAEGAPVVCLSVHTTRRRRRRRRWERRRHSTETSGERAPY